jgi:hypothetical protein
MPHVDMYDAHEDDTFTFTIEMIDPALPHTRALCLDDPESEITLEAWMTQTTQFIEAIKGALESESDAIISIAPIVARTEPTKEPLYWFTFIARADRAAAIQRKLIAYINSVHPQLHAT